MQHLESDRVCMWNTQAPFSLAMYPIHCPSFTSDPEQQSSFSAETRALPGIPAYFQESSQCTAFENTWSPGFGACPVLLQVLTANWRFPKTSLGKTPLDPVLVEAAITECHRLGALNNWNWFITVLEAGKYQIKVLACLVSVEHSLPGLLLAVTFSLCPHTHTVETGWEQTR